MKTRVSALLLLCFFSWGHLAHSGDKLVWATIDKRKIDRKVYEIAAQQNPYPAEYQYEKELLDSDLNATHDKLRAHEKSLDKKCALKQDGGENTINEISRRHRKTYSDGMPIDVYDEACLEKNKNDPLIVELASKIEGMNNIKKKQRAHDRLINRLAEEKVDSMLKEYGKNRFDLILDKNSSIYYKNNPMTLDATDDVIEYIEQNPIQISIPPMQSESLNLESSAPSTTP